MTAGCRPPVGRGRELQLIAGAMDRSCHATLQALWRDGLECATIGSVELAEVLHPAAGEGRR